MSKQNNQNLAVTAGKVLLGITGSAVAVYLGLRLYYNDRGIFTTRREDLKYLPNYDPIFGHALNGLKQVNYRMEQALEDAKKYGPVYQITVPALSVIVSTNVEDLQHVYADPYKYTKALKPADADQFHPLLGEGIFNVDGNAWKVQRKIAANLFTAKNFKDNFANIFLDEVDHILDHLHNAEGAGLVIEIQDLLLRSTLDAFCLLAMGQNVGALKMKASGKNGVYTFEPSEFMTAFDGLNEVLTRRLPWYQYTEFFGSEAGYKVKLYTKVIDTFAENIIKGKKKQVAEATNKGNDLLDLFMTHGNEDGSELSNRQLRDICLNFVIAGRDTTAQTTTWALREIAQRPDIEAKMIEEIKRVLGPNGRATHEACRDMKYVTAVFMETTRHLLLYPNVPESGKFATQDDVLPGTNTKVRRGEVVAWSSWVRARLPEIWGDDCLEFKPERWILPDGSIYKPSPAKHPSFNLGPRISIQEAVCFLSSILRSYHLELTNEDDPKHWGEWNENPALRKGRYGNHVTLSLRGGCEFKVHKRV
ncbi:hypothetical protein SmJEL517_g03480 [Synchytrium microbalum]|uniref:Cytochrome P450 n=1 Tax=Synchytrium microbalum TaxID=1806994 RepID=A0A507C8A9_9FUNG|nr:uncharacterized protein SmJEL517_g03480 [Synchytrium microbalum]TPX33735.1 hypothetical protein SmJEL517_g03480 [Synchytrium microbalum]